MNIKSILRSIRFLALLIGSMMMAGCSNSDKPTYLEPHLITTEATHITRTEATLNGLATIEGETEMPKLLFRYGTSESMNLSIRKIDVTAPYQQIPEHLDIDVTALKIGKSIKVGELSFEGLEIATGKDVIVCSIKMTRAAMSAAAASAE